MARVKEQSKDCETCGTSISRKRYSGRLEDLGAFKRRKFCSLSCANTREEVGYHGNSWRARKHLRKRCEICGGSKLLAAHHVDENRSNNTPENIQTLCVTCHNKLHHGTLLSPALIAQQPAFPLGWTDCEDSETLSFPKSLNGSEGE